MIREFFYCILRMGLVGPEYRSGIAQFKTDTNTSATTIFQDFQQGLARHTGHADFIVTAFTEILSVPQPAQGAEQIVNGADIITE